jgi:energy-coupling factor transport system ATP-binding protein
MNLQLTNVSFQHVDSDRAVISDLSLTVSPGEVVIVLGANGSGKSTLLHLMAGLLLPDEGAVTVEHLDTKNESQRFELRRTVGLVFQHPDYQIVSQTLEDDVAFGLENHQVAANKIGPRVYETLEKVGLRDLAERSPDTLSGGQLQRLALAGVLALEPHYLLLDEPFAWLDQPVQQQLWKTLRHVSKDKRALVVVTHETDLLAEADRVWLMHEGRLIADTTPSALLDDVGLFERIGMPTPPLLTLSHQLRQRGETPPAWYRVEHARDWLKPRFNQLVEESPDQVDDQRLPNSNIIHINEVGFSHERAQAVDDWLFSKINLDVDKADWITLSGPSGCGKSTLVQLLNGLLRPLAGTIGLDGESIADRSTAQLCRQVGLVFQNPRQQCFALTVEEEMGYALLDGGMQPDEVSAKVESVCKQLNLSPARPPQTLSGGEQIKVALGSILLLQPEVLILDETLTSLDPSTRIEILDLLDQLNQSGITIITVSHRPAQIPNTKRVAWLEDGTLQVYDLATMPNFCIPELAQLSVELFGQRINDVDKFIKLLPLPFPKL